MDCGKDTNRSEEYYALKLRVWRKINPVIWGMLCLACAERRLARDLTAADFLKVPVNAEQAKKCPALALRLKRLTVQSTSVRKPTQAAKKNTTNRSKRQLGIVSRNRRKFCQASERA